MSKKYTPFEGWYDIDGAVDDAMRVFTDVRRDVGIRSAVLTYIAHEQSIWRNCQVEEQKRTHIDHRAIVIGYLQAQDKIINHLTMIGYLEREEERERMVRAREYKRLHQRRSAKA